MLSSRRLERAGSGRARWRIPVQNAHPRSMIGTRRLLALALGLLMSTISCGRQQPMQTSHDLLAEFPWARVSGETLEVDFGTASGRRLLISGWSIDEWDHPRKENFVWGLRVGFIT